VSSLHNEVNEMSFSKIALFMALSGVLAPAFAAADHPAETADRPAAQRYDYQTELDIKKVIRMTDISNLCGGPLPVQMTYEDSQGQRHTIEYQVMGTGCSNG
jgi:hypothetical protein